MVLKRRISVVVPTFDRLAMLREALASIRDVESSGVQAEFEIVVGDNGLKEETRRLCLEYGAVYVPAHGRGASYARNAAMGAASGDFIAFLDDDDVWLRGHIEPHLAYLDAHPDHDAVFGQAIYTDPELNPTSAPWPEDPGSGDDLTRRMLSGLFPQIGTVVARRSVIDSIGSFDTRLIGGQDLDWLLRFATKNKLGFVPTPCILFRGRALETYDALNRMRVRFDRQVFLRHAMPNALRLWKSPLDMIRAYHKTLFHFYRYFTNRAIWCAENGSAGDVVRELKVPALYLPLLLASEIFQQSPLRTALLAAGRRWLKGGAGLPGRPPVGEAIAETAGPGPKAVGGPLAASEVSQTPEAKARALWSDVLTNGSMVTPTEAVLDELHRYSGIPLAEVDELVKTAASKTGLTWDARDRSTAQGLQEFYDRVDHWVYGTLGYHARQAEGKNVPLPVQVAAMLHARRPGAFLDFGAGVATAGLLFDRLGWQVTCADVSAPLLQFAKWRVEDRALPIRVIDLHSERLPEGAFDVICAFNTMAHVRDALQTLKDLRQALRPSGLLIFDVDTRPKDAEMPWHASKAAPVLRAVRRLGFAAEPQLGELHIFKKIESTLLARGIVGAQDLLKNTDAATWLRYQYWRRSRRT